MLWLAGTTDAIQGHHEVDSKAMAADFNAIVREAGWYVVSPLRCAQCAESRLLPAISMKQR